MRDPSDGRFLDVLQALVPMRMHELRHLGPDELARLGRAQIQAIAERADEAMYGGRTAREGLAAIVTGLAALALAAEGGVSFAGLHWCADHQVCLDAERGAAERGLQPAAAALVARPVVDVPLPPMPAGEVDGRG